MRTSYAPSLFRVAPVIGARSRIGRRLAEDLARGLGARVYVVDKSAGAGGIFAAGRHAKACVMDLADGPALRAAQSSLTTEFGAPHVLVNSVGTAALVPAAGCSPNQEQTTMAVNVTAPMC